MHAVAVQAHIGDAGKCTTRQNAKELGHEMSLPMTRRWMSLATLIPAEGASNVDPDKTQ